MSQTARFGGGRPWVRIPPSRLMAKRKWSEETIEKMRQSRREWYHRNKEKAKVAGSKYRQERRKWLQNYKSTICCIRCGENHPACLEFHHRDPVEKLFIISDGVLSKNYNLDDVMKEIAKCDVLCANCHRKLHFK